MATTVAPPAAAPSAPASAPSSPPPALSAPSAPETSSAPPPSTPAQHFDAKVDGLFDRLAKDSAAPPAGEPELAPPEIVTGDEPQEVVEESSQPPEAVAATQESPETETDDPYSEIKPDHDDGKRLHFKKAKADRLMDSHRTVMALREIDPNINADSVREMYGRTIELDRMITDYDSGDPERVANVLPTFINQQSNPASVAAFVDQAVAAAAQMHPNVYQVVQKKVLGGLAAQAYQKYLRTRDAADKGLAQNLDYMARGAFIDPDQAQTQVNPLAAREADLNRREQAINIRQNQERQEKITHAVKAAEQQETSVIQQAIDSALSVIPEQIRTQKATEYRHAQRDLRDKFDDVTKANPNYQKQRDILMQQVRVNPSDETRNALAGFVKSWADYAAGIGKSEILQRFSSSVTSQSTAAHKAQEAIQQRREPGSGGPVQRATVKAQLSDPKLDYNQKWDVLDRAVRGR